MNGQRMMNIYFSFNIFNENEKIWTENHRRFMKWIVSPYWVEVVFGKKDSKLTKKPKFARKGVKCMHVKWTKKKRNDIFFKLSKIFISIYVCGQYFGAVSFIILVLCLKFIPQCVYVNRECATTQISHLNQIIGSKVSENLTNGTKDWASD